jgi:hypothetical protein
MHLSYCPTCQKETGHQRRLGWGTFFGALFTFGISLFFIPFYPKRCVVCGRRQLRGGPFVAPIPAAPPVFSLNEVTKKCPFCAETVKIEALKCRFCGEIFDPEDVARQVAACQAQIDADLEKLKAGKKFCPSCGHWDVIHGAALPDGSFGDWCPHCQRPVA